MNAGRELDALVAERIMGLHLAKQEFTGELFIRYSKDTGLFQIPEYSADISAAWEVVEKLRETWRLEIDESKDRWQIHIENDDKVLRDDAPTFPHAICLVALKAVGVEV